MQARAVHREGKMKLKNWLAASLICTATLVSIPLRANEPPVLVDADQFKCLVEKIRTIPLENKGIYVNIRNCRNGGLRIIRHLVPPPRQPDASGVESLLYLKPAQVKCIRKNSTAVARITDPAGLGRLRLKLNPCGR